MKKPIIIAIDGPASSGKGTIAKLLAKELAYIYLDTGAMYRALTYFCLEKKIDMADEEQVYQACEKMNLRFTQDGETFLDDIDVSVEIRSKEVNQLVSSVISLYPRVRALMVEKQRAYGKMENIVMDGRDIGTIVFPEATVKLFISSSLKVRAKRRYEQNIASGLLDSYQTVENMLAERDMTDLNRDISPLLKAEDAIVIDSTNENVEQTLQRTVACVKRKVEHYSCYQL